MSMTVITNNWFFFFVYILDCLSEEPILKCILPLYLFNVPHVYVEQFWWSERAANKDLLKLLVCQFPSL